MQREFFGRVGPGCTLFILLGLVGSAGFVKFAFEKGISFLKPGPTLKDRVVDSFLNMMMP